MATKTKARKSVMDNSPKLQKAIRGVQQACRQIEGYFQEAAQADRSLQNALESLSDTASSLHDLLEASKRGRSPSERERVLSVVRKHVAKRVQKLPSVHSRQPKASVRKRVARKPSGKEFFHGQDIPH